MRQIASLLALLFFASSTDLTAQEAVVLTGGRINRTQVRVGAYVRATCRKSDRRVEIIEGYIRATDDSTLTVGIGLYREKIAYRDILRLISGRTPAEVLRMERAVVKMESSKDMELSGLKAGAGWGYVFAAPGGLAWSSGAVGTGHLGFGGDVLFHRRFGVSGSLGYLATFMAFGEGSGVLSFNGTFYGAGKKSVPFITFGRSWFSSGWGSLGVWNVGAGVNTWLGRNLGLRTEVRTHFFSAPFGVVELRLGLNFR